MNSQSYVEEYTYSFVYKSALGDEVTWNHIDLPEKRKSEGVPIKINLAGSLYNYINGAGECINAVTNEKGLVFANSNRHKGRMFFVRLLENSKYYDGLKRGMYVLVESKGEDGRPIANYHELRLRFGESNWN